MPFEVTPNVEVRRDETQRVRSLRHLQEPYGPDESGLTTPTPQTMANQYVRDVAPVYDIPDEMLSDLGRRFDRAPEKPTEEGARIRPEEEKRLQETTVLRYKQTYLDLPIWRSHLTVRMHDDPLRVTSSSQSIHFDIDIDRPNLDEGKYLPERMQEKRLIQVLGLQKRKSLPTINDTRLLIYRYDPDARIRQEEDDQHEERLLHETPPTLPLPPVSDEIEPGQHYVVTEVLFSYPLEGWGQLNWRAFVEPRTGDVLYLRAFVDAATGRVFPVDYLDDTPQPDIDCCDSATDLDPETISVTLANLETPSSGDPQELTGDYIELSDTNSPSIDPPTASLPSADFSESATTDDFAAISAYHYLDRLYQLVDDFGFDTSSYFDGTSFPITTDHRGHSGVVNARAAGNTSGDGMQRYTFGLCDSGCDVGIAADARVVIHEFGHAILWDHLDSPNFGFAHSPGDSLATILNDPGTEMSDRFETFPWEGIGRRHDREPTDGWAWGGSQHGAQYQGEQILSTSLFRAYRSTGGDHPNRTVQRFAARYLAYLIIRAVGSMSSTTTDPADFATALMDADLGTSDFEGHPGGAFHKVVRWAFEKQGLYNPPDGPSPSDPVDEEGDPPDIDVYIDDGRSGEYDFLQRFWSTTDLWNRLDSDGGTDHETPVTGQTNYLYVRVKNRGQTTADDVTVRAFRCRPGAGLVWPDDWQAMTTAELSTGSIPTGGTAIVGPFEWTPVEVGHECLLAIVDADGDLANDTTVGSSIPHWRFVPFDNNIAQRNVAPVAGGGGSLNLERSFEDRHFWANNPFDRTVDVELDVRIPSFLRERGYELRFTSRGGSSFSLGPRDSREIVMQLETGEEFGPHDVQAADSRTIDVQVVIDELPLGGMSYELDPELENPPRERPKPTEKPEEDCEDTAGRLLDCLGVSEDEVKSVDVTRVSLDIILDDEDC
ncbi:MAG: hypothetical protein ACLFNI_04205 [Natronomonas sp.]